MAKEKESEHHDKEEKPQKRHKKKVSKKKLMLLLMGLIIGVIVGYASNLILPGTNVNCDMSVGEEAQKYVVDNFLAVQGLGAELGNVEQVGTICQIDLSITSNGTKLQDSIVYMTPEGDYLILGQVIDTSENMLEEEPTPEEQEQQQTASCEDLTKEDNPVLSAFVVSYCPFGVQMQRVLAKIVEGAPDLAEYIDVRYMGAVVDGEVTAMHGEQEAQENLRQICIREEQSDKFWDYIDCFIIGGDYEICLVEADIDTSMLETCMTGEKGLEYAQEDFDLQNEYSVTGSPTLILNGERVSEFDFGGRSAEAVKTVVCCGFNDKPEVCSVDLTTEQAARSFSETYSEGGSTSGGGSC